MVDDHFYERSVITAVESERLALSEANRLLVKIAECLESARRASLQQVNEGEFVGEDGGKLYNNLHLRVSFYGALAAICRGQLDATIIRMLENKGVEP